MTTTTTPELSAVHAALNDLPAYCCSLASAARAASRIVGAASGTTRQAALQGMADAIESRTVELQAANQLDLDAAPGLGLSDAMIDRLRLTDDRLASMALGVRDIAAQEDPVGAVLDGRVLPNGIRLLRRRVPLGVVLIIFESRPNVTADAAALCLKAGNAAILRGGKEALHSNRAIAECVRLGLEQAGLPGEAVQLVGTTDRAAVGHLLQLDQDIDVCIPRGGESLIRAVVEQSKIPVIKHYTGNCHVYIDRHADAAMAEQIALNAKTQRTGVCNAAETFLFHAGCIESGLVKRVCDALLDAGVELRGCNLTRAAVGEHAKLRPGGDEDWAEEYLDMIAAVRVVDSVSEAANHINLWGSRHTDAIVSDNVDSIQAFMQAVDTANLMVNCSTRFSDGQQYGLGAEIGISTDKLHARGPMGAADLCTYQWVAQGHGQTRN
ncbi:MAG: glutamate-5-semialdehyde dehydrogenase [Planctomycetota bacterium]